MWQVYTFSQMRLKRLFEGYLLHTNVMINRILEVRWEAGRQKPPRPPVFRVS